MYKINPKYLYALIIIISNLITNYCFSQENGKKYVLKGVLQGLGNAKVLLGNKGLSINNSTKVVYIDSCQSKNDSFEFKGYFKESNFYSIEVPNNYKGWRYFIMDSNEIFINGHVDSIHLARISGSVENAIFFNYRLNIYKPQVLKLDSIRAKIDSIKLIILEKSKSKQLNKLNNRINRITITIKKDEANYINKYNNSFTAIFLISNLFARNPKETKIHQYISLLSLNNRNHSIVQSMLAKINNSLSLNSIAPNILINDTFGVKKSIVYTSEYNLLNFWASWCKPCIAELPQLSKIYNKYPRDYFNIIGVSIDSNVHNWKSSISKLNLPWEQFIETNYQNSELNTYYNLSFIPKLFLINRSGELVLIDTELNKLSEYLSKYYK